MNKGAGMASAFRYDAFMTGLYYYDAREVFLFQRPNVKHYVRRGKEARQQADLSRSFGCIYRPGVDE
jgi:hypothetical protein